MIKLAIVQLRTEPEQRETMEKAERLIRKAAQNGAEIVVLPEMFNCPYDNACFRRLGEGKRRPARRRLHPGARRRKALQHLLHL